jgi:hypothetical protein
MSDRTISLGDVDNATAESMLRSQPDAFGNIAESVPKFTKVDDFTTFAAEYCRIDDNIVIHFFHPEDMEYTERYWLDVFPGVLDSVAREYFNADTPRLVAKYTEELRSWWFRANSYDHVIDVDYFVRRFFEKMDQALEPSAPATKTQ